MLFKLPKICHLLQCWLRPYINKCQLSWVLCNCTNRNVAGQQRIQGIGEAGNAIWGNEILIRAEVITPCLTALIFCFIIDEIQTKLHFFPLPAAGSEAQPAFYAPLLLFGGCQIHFELSLVVEVQGEVRAVTSELPFSCALKMELHLMGWALEREEGSWELFLHPLLWFKSPFVGWKPPFGGRFRFWGGLGVGIVSRSQ